MARQFKLPDLGEGIHEGEILKILVSQGDQIEEDQTILEVETDKAAVEIPSPYEGAITKIHVSEGDLVKVGEVLLTFNGAAGAEEATEAEAETEPQPEEEPPAEREPAADSGREADGAPSRDKDPPIPAAPSTRRLARELEVDLRQVPASGPSGRVTSEDVRSYADGTEAPAQDEPAPPEAGRPPAIEISPVRPSAIPLPDLPDFSRWGEIELLPLRSIRRSTARNMTLSWSQIPHVNHQDVADITELEAFRQRYKDEIQSDDLNLTLTVFAMKAAVAALKAHPRFNASLDAESQEIILKHYYHIGVAVDIEDGLLVPVVRDVDRKSILELATELDNLLARTRQREATLEEMQGGSFTITNPGPLGGTGFTPLIKYPEVAILGLAQARWQPVVQGEGQDASLAPRFLLPLVLSFDHRVVDGADAARFLNTVIQILEDPDHLLVQT